MSNWFAKINDRAHTGAAIIAGLWVWLLSIELFRQAGADSGQWIVALLLGPIICTVVHELGHAAFTLLAGWRVTLIHIAPFAWRPSDNRFALVGARGGQDVAGYCAMVPNKAGASRWGYVLGVLGGPIASIALAVAAAIAATALNTPFLHSAGELIPSAGSDLLVRATQPPETWRNAISPFFTSVALQSAYAALFSLWPAHLKSGGNDGALIAHALAPNNDLGNPFVWANGLLREGVSPRDWPTWLASAINDKMRTESPPSGAAMLALYLAVDSSPMNVQGARSAIEHLKTSDASSDPNVQDWLSHWDAIVASLMEVDAERAALALKSADPAHERDPALMRVAEAAVAARRGDARAMQTALAALDRELKREPLRASGWKRLALAIRESLSSSPPQTT